MGISLIPLTPSLSGNSSLFEIKCDYDVFFFHVKNFQQNVNNLQSLIPECVKT